MDTSPVLRAFLQQEVLHYVNGGSKAALVELPLVLHGGTGTPANLIKQAILSPSVSGAFYRPAHLAMKNKVIEIIELFRNGRTW